MKTPISAKTVLAFLTSLDCSELSITSEQHVDATRLLLALAKSNEWPDDQHVLRDLLSPIFCCSAADQAYFYSCFSRWFDRQSVSDDPEMAQSPGDEATGATTRSRPRPHFSWFGVLAYCAVIAILAGTTGEPRQLALRAGISGRVQTVAGSRLAGVRIQYPGQDAISGRDGEFVVYSDSHGFPFHVLVSTSGFRPELLRIESPEPMLIVLAAEQPSSSPLLETSGPAAATPAPAKTFLRQTAVLLLYFSVPIPFIAVLLFLYRWRVKLQRWRSHLEPRSQMLSRTTHEGGIYSGAEVQELAAEISRQASSVRAHLDIQKTADASAAHGGLLTPVYARRGIEPGHVFLVHRLNQRDHQAALYSLLGDRLRDWAVPLETYYYLGDFQACWELNENDGESPRYFNLDSLAAHVRSKPLCIFGDRASLIHPLRNELAPWGDVLQSWPHVALLEPVPSPETDRVRLGICVVDADLEGLRGVTNYFVSGQLPDVSTDEKVRRCFPTLLTTFRSEWLEHRAPKISVISELLAELRKYLGPDGMLCLKACAAYPAPFWDLTLHFASTFIQAPREATIERLVALPWFRYGQMPDWFRVHLLAELSRSETARVRAALEQFLGTLLSDGPKVARREILKPSAVPGMLSPLQDYIFASFILGNEFDPLTPTMPKSISRKLLFKGYVSAALVQLAVDKIAQHIDGMLERLISRWRFWSRPNSRKDLGQLAAGKTGEARSIRLIAACVAVLFSLGITDALVHFQAVEYGYRIAALETELERLTELNHLLKLEEASLRDPARIDALARQIGLEAPKPGQVIRLEQTPEQRQALLETETKVVSTVERIAQSQIGHKTANPWEFAEWCIDVANEIMGGNLTLGRPESTRPFSDALPLETLQPGFVLFDIETGKTGIIHQTGPQAIEIIAVPEIGSAVRYLEIPLSSKIVIVNPLNGARYGSSR